jgi:hypothetical protein
VSPHIKSVSEHIDVLVTLYHVKLIEASDIWLIKQAVNGLHNKVEHIKNAGVVLDDEIISKIVKENIKEILKSIPTPPKFQYQEDASVAETEEEKEDASPFSEKNTLTRLLETDSTKESKPQSEQPIANKPELTIEDVITSDDSKLKDSEK